MRKLQRLGLATACSIIGTVLLPIAVVLSCIAAILEWIGGAVYVFTGNHIVCDMVAEWHENTAEICRSKPFD